MEFAIGLNPPPHPPTPPSVIWLNAMTPLCLWVWSSIVYCNQLELKQDLAALSITLRVGDSGLNQYHHSDSWL